MRCCEKFHFGMVSAFFDPSLETPRGRQEALLLRWRGREVDTQKEHR